MLMRKGGREGQSSLSGSGSMCRDVDREGWEHWLEQSKTPSLLSGSTFALKGADAGFIGILCPSACQSSCTETGGQSFSGGVHLWPPGLPGHSKVAYWG